MATTAIAIRPATIEDAAAIAHVHYRALERYHEFYGAFLARHPREILPLATERALKQDGKFVFWVAVDEGSGDVVGFVRYNFVEAADTTIKEGEAGENASEIKQEEEDAGGELFAPKEHLKGLWERFNERQAEMDACGEKALQGKKHIFINHLMIDPDYQRRGIGRQLLERVLQQSEDGTLPTYIVSSAEWRELYAKVGFESLGKWRIDNGYWAGEVVKVEKEAGVMRGSEGLEERFRGMEKVEDCMVRWPLNGGDGVVVVVDG